jgi:hypothetical protein
MIEIIYFIPILLSAFAIGNFLFRLFNLKTTYLEEFIFSIVLGFGFYSYFTLFLGLMGWMYAWIYWAVILLSLILWRKALSNFTKSIFSHIKKFKIKFNLVTFLIITIAIFTILAILSALTPPFLWDEMDYRLAHPKIWARHHELTPIFSRWFSEFPSNIELLYTIGILLKNGILSKFFSLSYGLLLAAAIFSFSKRFYNGIIGLIASSVYLSLPMVMNHIGSAYIDISIASLAFAAFYCLMLWIKDKKPGWLYLCGIFTGLSLASKYTAVIPALLLGIFIIYFSWKDNGFLKSVKNTIIFSSITVLLVVPWLLKAYFRTSNPVWPFFYNIIGGNYWSSAINNYFFRSLDQAPFSYLLDFIIYPWNITMHSSSFSLLLGWNAVFLSFVPLLIFYRKIEKTTKYLLSYSLLFLYIAIPSAYIFFGVMRYLLVYSSLSIISALVIYSLLKRKIMGKIAITILVLTFLFTCVLWYGIFGQKMSYVFGLENEGEFYGKLIDYNGYPVFDYMNMNIPKNSMVFLFRETRGYLSDRDYIVALPNEQNIIDYNHNGDTFYAQLKNLGITHVLVNTNIEFYKPQEEVMDRRKPFSQEHQKTMDSVLRKYGTLLLEDKGVYLYSLK